MSFCSGIITGEGMIFFLVAAFLVYYSPKINSSMIYKYYFLLSAVLLVFVAWGELYCEPARKYWLFDLYSLCSPYVAIGGFLAFLPGLPGLFSRLHEKNAVIIEVEKLKEQDDEYLQKLLFEQKCFLDPDLSLGSLAIKVKMTPHQLSAHINNRYGVRFQELINRSRVQYAIELNERSPEKTWNEIARSSGFSAYNTFYLAFKKHVGVSCTSYRQIKGR